MMGTITDRPQTTSVPAYGKRDSVEVMTVSCSRAMVTLSVYQRTLFYTLLMCTFLSDRSKVGQCCDDAGLS